MHVIYQSIGSTADKSFSVTRSLPIAVAYSLGVIYTHTHHTAPHFNDDTMGFDEEAKESICRCDSDKTGGLGGN
jgi:hypothetical protein